MSLSQPVDQCPGNRRRLFQGGQVTTVGYLSQLRSRDEASDLGRVFRRGQIVVRAHQNECWALDGGKIGAGIRTVHDRVVLANERLGAGLVGHLANYPLQRNVVSATGMHPAPERVVDYLGELAALGKRDLVVAAPYLFRRICARRRVEEGKMRHPVAGCGSLSGRWARPLSRLTFACAPGTVGPGGNARRLGLGRPHWRRLWHHGAVTGAERGAAGLRQLVGLEISAVCFVRDYVEVHFDGPVLRAFSNPFGRYGCQSWRFPEGNSLTMMRYFIGKTVYEVELIPDVLLAVDCGEHRFAVPLDEASRSGPEAAQLVFPGVSGEASGRRMWIW